MREHALRCVRWLKVWSWDVLDRLEFKLLRPFDPNDPVWHTSEPMTDDEWTSFQEGL